MEDLSVSLFLLLRLNKNKNKSLKNKESRDGMNNITEMQRFLKITVSNYMEKKFNNLEKMEVLWERKPQLD